MSGHLDFYSAVQLMRCPALLKIFMLGFFSLATLLACLHIRIKCP